MKVLFLGGTGYLGSKLIHKLIAENCSVGCIIRNESSLRRLEDISNKIQFIPVSSVDEQIPKNYYDCFINTAVKYQKKDTHEADILTVNYQIPSNIFLNGIEKNIQKFITIDTGLPKEFNMYSFSKKQFAELGKWFCKRKEISFYNIKLEYFYGEDEPKNRFLQYVINQLIINKDVDLTLGDQKRDFIYIDDVLNNLMRLVKLERKGYWDIPLGTGEGPTVKEAVEYLKSISGSSSSLNFGAIPKRDNEPDSVADIKMMQRFDIKINYPWKVGFENLLKGRR